MDSLNEKDFLKEQVCAGRSIGEIQSAYNTKFQQTKTYSEIRFLIDDLGIEFAQQKESAKKTQEPQEAVLLGKVSVTTDPIQRPGSILSGSVSFSDGEKAQWQLDPMGRLGLDPNQEGYKPSAEDVQAFQQELQKQLSRFGF